MLQTMNKRLIGGSSVASRGSADDLSFLLVLIFRLWKLLKYFTYEIFCVIELFTETSGDVEERFEICPLKFYLNSQDSYKVFVNF